MNGSPRGRTQRESEARAERKKVLRHADGPTCHCRCEPGSLSFEIDDVIDRAD